MHARCRVGSATHEHHLLKVLLQQRHRACLKMARRTQLPQQSDQSPIVDARALEDLVRVEQGRREDAELTHRGPGVEVSFEDVQCVDEELARWRVAQDNEEVLQGCDDEWSACEPVPLDLP